MSTEAQTVDSLKLVEKSLEKHLSKESLKIRQEVSEDLFRDGCMSSVSHHVAFIERLCEDNESLKGEIEYLEGVISENKYQKDNENPDFPFIKGEIVAFRILASYKLFEVVFYDKDSILLEDYQTKTRTLYSAEVRKDATRMIKATPAVKKAISILDKICEVPGNASLLGANSFSELVKELDCLNDNCLN